MQDRFLAFVERVGAPMALALVLLWLLLQTVPDLQAAVTAHEQHRADSDRIIIEILRASCLNEADTPSEVARCEVTR